MCFGVRQDARMAAARENGHFKSAELPDVLRLPLLSQDHHHHTSPFRPRCLMEEVLFRQLCPLSRSKALPRKGTQRSNHHERTGEQHKRKYTQTFLDLGQRSYGKRTLCPDCGLLYVNGESQDERDHATFCKSVTDGVSLVGWKNERVTRVVGTEHRVLEVRPTDGSHQLEKVAEVKRIMDAEMGFVPQAQPLAARQQAAGAGSDSERPLAPAQKAFLYVRDAKVVGCVIAEEVTRAYPLLTDDDRTARPKEKEEQPGMEFPSPPLIGDEELRGSTMVGVRQIWVSRSYRRHGIATALVDTVRHRFYFGCTVHRELVVFSQLSTMGQRFARSYVPQEQRVLVH